MMSYKNWFDVDLLILILIKGIPFIPSTSGTTPG